MTRYLSKTIGHMLAARSLVCAFDLSPGASVTCMNTKWPILTLSPITLSSRRQPRDLSSVRLSTWTEILDRSVEINREREAITSALLTLQCRLWTTYIEMDEIDE